MKPFRFRMKRVHRREFLQLGGLGTLAWLVGCEASESDGTDGDNSEWTDVPEAELQEIPPVTSNDDHYEVSTLGMVDVNADDWVCTVRIGDQELGQFDYGFLESLETRDKEHTLQCIESKPGDQRMSNAVWSGLPLNEVLAAAGIDVEGPEEFIKFSCVDGYTTGLPKEYIADLPLWLVWKMNGEPLPRKHGFPARILTPGLYGWKNPKQVSDIELLTYPFFAVWESMYAGSEDWADKDIFWAWNYKPQGLIVSPDELQVVHTGDTISMLGKAFAGTDPVTWVGISADGGKTFSDAELTYAPGPDRWALWRQKWKPSTPGVYVLVVACRTEGGNETDPEAKASATPFTGGMALAIEVF